MRDRDVAIGNSVVVHAPLDHSGYENVQLIPVDYDWSEIDTALERAIPKWRDYRSRGASLSGTKAGPVRLTVPLTDTPTLHIEYSSVDFGFGHSFNQLIQDDPTIQTALVSRAFAFETSQGRDLPGLLGIQGVVSTGRERIGMAPSEQRHLLLAHRVRRREGYYDARWSASFEEQFANMQSEWGGRLRPADRTLAETVLLGLREEFVTDSFTKAISVSFHAVLIELENLNMQVLAVINLPDTTFSEVNNLWPTAVDAAEHDALAAIPLEVEVLRSALSSRGPIAIPSIHCDPSNADKLNDPWHLVSLSAY